MKLMTTWRILKATSGFTLIEMLISISIFMLFIAIAAGSYTNLVSANRRANETQRIYREVRFVFDTLGQAIRNGSLDYSCLDPTQLDALCLENQSGQGSVLSVVREDETGLSRQVFRFDGENKRFLELSQTRPSPLAAWTMGDWKPLTSESLPLEHLSFEVFPLQNPYEAAHVENDAVQFQPSVTIRTKVAGYEFQTTYSSRIYGKKNA